MELHYFTAEPKHEAIVFGRRLRLSTPLAVIARSPCDEAIQGPRAVAPGLLRCARNDGGVDATIIGHRLSRAPPGLGVTAVAKKGAQYFEIARCKTEISTGVPPSDRKSRGCPARGRE